MTSNLEELKQYSVNIRRKRQTSTPPSSEEATQLPLLPTELTKSALSTETTPPANNSDSSAWNRSSSSSAKNNTSSNESVSKSTSGISLEQRTLVGVNGTGQRKNLTKPFMVSEPINDSSSAPNILKPIKLGSSSDESDKPIIDDVDIPDDDTNKLAKENNITEFKDVSRIWFECF